jgi:hypothetical protein
LVGYRAEHDIFGGHILRDAIAAEKPGFQGLEA